jgi:putative membrane protein
VNTQILKKAHLVALVAFVLLGVVVTASSTSYNSSQNQNENKNSSQQNKNSSQRNKNMVSNDNMNSNSNASQNVNENANAATSNQNTGTAAEGARVGASALSSDDRKFMTTAAMSGRKEVELSRLATERATDPAVKQFAQRMVEEHTRANEELMLMASKKGITLPNRRDAKLQSTLTRMQKLSGADFDRAYLKEAGVSEHEKAVKLFEDQSQHGTDADTRAFAAKLLPGIQEHLSVARQLSGTATDSNTNSNSNVNSNANKNMNSNANTPPNP